MLGRSQGRTEAAAREVVADDNVFDPNNVQVRDTINTTALTTHPIMSAVYIS